MASSLASFSQFEFFIANRDNPISGFPIGKPVTGLVPGRIVIPQTQRLANKEGGFAGVLLFSTDPARATALYHRVDLGNNGSIMIAGTDGTIFGGYILPRGLDPSIIGQNFADNEVMAHLQGTPSGSTIAVSPINGIARVHSWRRLPLHRGCRAWKGGGFGGCQPASSLFVGLCHFCGCPLGITVSTLSP